MFYFSVVDIKMASQWEKNIKKQQNDLHNVFLSSTNVTDGQNAHVFCGMSVV